MSAFKENKITHELFFPLMLVFIEVITYLSTDMYLPALPSIADHFRVDQDTAQSTLTLWFLGSMSLQLFLGPLCEKYGRKLILSIGVVIFIVTALICGVTDNINVFLTARFFQGTTVCIVIVAGYAMIHELYSGKRAVQILAIMGSVTILAPAMGPLVGAVIISLSHWKNIFILLALCGIIGLIGLQVSLPSENSSASKRISLKQEYGYYKSILTNSIFMRIALANGLLIINFFIWIVESPFIIIKHYQQTEFYFGVAQTIVFMGFIIGAQLARRLVVKLSTKAMCMLGLSIMASALTCFLGFSLMNLDAMFIVLAMMTIAIGSSSISGTLNRLAISSSSAPMSHRVAIYTLVVSFAATAGSYAVTLINDQNFSSIAWLMVGCFTMAIGIFLSLKNHIANTCL